MAWWMPILKAIGGALLSGGLKTMFGPKGTVRKGALVSRRPPPSYDTGYIRARQEERSKYAASEQPFTPKAFRQKRGQARPVGAEPALEAVNPSQMESRYWSAIFSDAKARSQIGFRGIGERD